MLNNNGVLFTRNLTCQRVRWMKTMQMAWRWSMASTAGLNLSADSQATHHVAFMPLFGGTLVAWLPHA